MLPQTKRKSLILLYLPLFFEALTVALINIIDVAMVSSVGDAAVGAVGSSGVYLRLIENCLGIVSVGAGAMMSRYVGANRPGLAKKALIYTLLVNTAIGGLFTLTFLFFSGQIMTAVGTNPTIYDGAVIYIKYVGASMVFLAANLVFNAYLRAFGKPNLTLISGMLGNLLNVGLNALFIYKGLGILGVALASLIARAVNLVLSAAFTLFIRFERENTSDVTPKQLLSSVFGIGLPGAGESMLFALCSSVSMSFINQMDAEGIAVNAYSYCSQICGVIYCIVTAYAQLNGILSGWSMGAKDFDRAYRETHRLFSFGLILCTATDLAFVPLARPILSLMTENETILSMAAPILAIHAVRLCGMLGNNVYGIALKTAGDAKILLLYSIILMPLWVFVGSYFLGIVCGLGLYGYWIGATLDEVSRATMMFLRWRSRRWEAKIKQ